MWKIFDFLVASSKVTYDKTIDYITYYTNDNKNDNLSNSINSDDNSDNEDDIYEHNEFIDIENYQDNKQYNRILPEVSYYNMLLTFFDDPTHIIDNIYLGSAFNASSKNTLHQYKIKVILNITKEISNYFPDEFIYKRYNLYDNNKDCILEYLKKTFEDIIYHQKNTEGNILIHCFMGRSRSASVVLYYLMKTLKHNDGTPYNFDETLHLLKKKRSIINPTFRFTKDLAKSIMFK